MQSPRSIKSQVTLTVGMSIGVLIIYSLCYKFIDISLMYTVYHACQNTVLVPIAHHIKSIFSVSHYVLLAILLGVIGFGFQFKKDARLGYKLLFLAMSILLATIVATLLKYGLARYRPIDLMLNKEYGFHFFSMVDVYNSTPSGHATLSFACFYGLARIFSKSWLTPLLLIPPILISLSRLVLADHYLSDLILGAFLGLISVSWSSYFTNRFILTVEGHTHD